MRDMSTLTSRLPNPWTSPKSIWQSSPRIHGTSNQPKSICLLRPPPRRIKDRSKDRHPRQLIVISTLCEQRQFVDAKIFVRRKRQGSWDADLSAELSWTVPAHFVSRVRKKKIDTRTKQGRQLWEKRDPRASFKTRYLKGLSPHKNPSP